MTRINKEIMYARLLEAAREQVEDGNDDVPSWVTAHWIIKILEERNEMICRLNNAEKGESHDN